MFRIFTPLIFIVSIILGELTLADDASKNSEEVIVKGIGETKSEAISDAQRQALIQVVGKYVVSRDILKNRKQLSENIYSYSNGFISDFEILDMQDQNGLVEIEVRSVVSRTKLFKVFEGLNITRLSLDGTAADLASSSANQSRDFANLMRDQFFGALAERNIFDIEITDMEIVDTFPKDYLIFLSRDAWLTSLEVSVGNGLFDTFCDYSSDCRDKFTKGLMTGILVKLEVQIKPEFIASIEQLFDIVSNEKKTVGTQCGNDCKIYKQSNLEGIIVKDYKSNLGKGTNYLLSTKNEMIFDAIASEYGNYSFWLDLKILDFSGKEINQFSYNTEDFNWSAMFSEFSSTTRQFSNGYGSNGILAYQPQFARKEVASKIESADLFKFFGLGLNTHNYSLVDPSTSILQFPFMITEEIAGNLSEIEVEILWERR